MNQSINQLRDLFLSMTPAARITSALLLAVIVVSLGYLFQQHQAGGNDFLFSGQFLEPSDADRVEAAIAQAGLSGYKREGGRISVPSGQKAEYLAAVANAGALPANFDALMTEALSGSAFDSRPVQQQRIKNVLQRQLSMIVSAMDGVEQARVLYDVQQPQGFQKRQVSATVSVRPAAGEALTPKRAKMIRAAVAGAIAGLDPDGVTILNTADGSSSLAGGGVSPDEFDNPYYHTKAQYEEFLRVKIANLLDRIPGMRVQVSADLDKVLTMESRTVKSEGDAMVLRENNDSETVTNTRTELGQRPGTFVQGPGAPPADDQATIVSKTEITDTDNEFFPATSEQLLTESGLVPKHVRVSVSIPSDYVERVWREQTPDAEPDARPTTEQLDRIKDQTKTDIQTIVKPQLPEQIGKEDYNVVQVSYFQSLTPTPAAPPSLASEAWFWTQRHSNSLLTGLFALIVLLMLRSVIKAIPTTEAAVSFDLPAAADQSASDNQPASDDDNAQDKRPKLKLKKGPTLKDDLTEIVREDPDAAAAILRSWISKAA